MGFPIDMTMTLSGATRPQLSHWRRSGLLVPEASPSRPIEYSFRDIVALRSVVYLRRSTSLQRVRKAFGSLERMDLTEHPSVYSLVTDGDTIAVVRNDETIDLVRSPGQTVLAPLIDIFDAFDSPKGRRVPNLLNPRPTIEIRERRLGGWPTISGTRLGYDNVVALVSDGSVPYEQVSDFYPGVTVDMVRDAVDFDHTVRQAA